MNSGAYVDGMHRYHLWRNWNRSKPSCVWVMLNPSTADARIDDPTIRKCMGFANRWGFGAIDVVNLYTYRATSPKDLRAAGFPNGPEADRVILDVLGGLYHPVGRVVFAWGRHGRAERVAKVEALCRVTGCPTPVALRLNKDGSPQHPLYVPWDATPVAFEAD